MHQEGACLPIYKKSTRGNMTSWTEAITKPFIHISKKHQVSLKAKYVNKLNFKPL